MPLSIPCPKCQTAIDPGVKPAEGQHLQCPKCGLEVAMESGKAIPVAVPSIPEAVPVIPVAIPMAAAAPVPAPAWVGAAEPRHAAASVPSPAKHAVLHVESTPARPAPCAAAFVAPPASKPVKQVDKKEERHASPDKEHKRKHHHRSHRHEKHQRHDPAPQPAHSEGDNLDFVGQSNGIVTKPKLRPPSRIATLARRAVRVGLFLCLLGVVGGAGTVGYFLLVKYGVIGGRSASHPSDVAKNEGDGNGAAAEESGPQNAVNPGTGNEDPLAFIPGDANLIIGFNGADLITNPTLKPLVDHVLVEAGMLKLLANCKTQTGLELKDLFSTVLIAMKARSDLIHLESTTLVLQSSVAFDQKRLGRWVSAKAARQINEKFYYDQHRDLPWVKTVYMPSDRILVLSDIAAKEWAILFDADGSTPAAPPDTLGLIRPLEKNPAWAVMSFDLKTKEEIKAGKGPAQIMALLLANDVMPTVQKVLPEAKGMTLRASLVNNQLGIALGVSCANDPHAVELKNMLHASWARNKPIKSKKLADTLVLEAEERQQIVNGLTASLQIDQKQNLVEASLSVSQEPFRKLLKDGALAFQNQAEETLGLIVGDLGLPPPPEKSVELSADEKVILERVNQFRNDGFQLQPMKPHARLMALARAHAANMAKQGKAEDDLDGKDTVIRVKDIGYKFGLNKLDFNLAAGEKLTAKEAADKMLKNPAKQGLHFVEYTDTGIGLAKNDATGQVYYYQIFAMPEK
jgi:uncharacterized protein YkwD